MTQNYRPFSWEEYLKNPELLRTRDGREVKQLKMFTGVMRYHLVGIINKSIFSWTLEGKYSSTSVKDNQIDLVLLNPQTETKKYYVIIKDPITGDTIDEKFVDSFCLFD